MIARVLFFIWLAFILCGMTLLGSFPGLTGTDVWQNRPNDPEYRGMWHLFSQVPKGHRQKVTEWDAKHGSGMHVDRAWQLHTGSPDTIIAVLDSGVRWHDSDLLEKHFLNIGELPLPEGSITYDANGDGKFTVSDYAGDSRITDANGNGVLDPGDLIAAFSDGVDDDENGFKDDISGWDFHEMDNNPEDRTDFGHGTGEAKASAAGLNNKIGKSGICGGCRVVSVRINDSFIVDAQSFAAGVKFAQSTKVDLIQQALGAINHTPAVTKAVNDAYDAGIIIIGSAADEHSYHHNFPSVIDPIIYTNALRYDSKDVRNATTFVNFNNCSNFGARIDVATSGRSCSSEATGNLSGIAALAISYAKHLSRKLTPGSLISLIKASADDINFGPSEEGGDRFPTYKGWDSMTGYGRPNAYRILKAIKDNLIPAEARIRSPGWFEIWLPDQDIFTLAYDAVSTGGDILDVSLSVARGVESPEEAFVTIYQESFIKGIRNRKVAVPKSAMTSLVPHAREHERNFDAYTFRLRVEQNGRPMSESRRTIFLLQEQPSHLFKLEASGEPGGMFVDLNRDGNDEWVTVDGDGNLMARGLEGIVPGFPVKCGSSRHGVGGAGVFAPPAAGDINNDGFDEIVVISMDGHISAFNSRGESLSGFPVLVERPDFIGVSQDEIIAGGFLAAPVLVDLDNDGYLDIVAAGQDGLLHAYDRLGRKLSGFPLAIRAGGKRARLLSSPAIGDLDRDGFPDLVFGSNHTGDEAGYVFAISGRTLASVGKAFPVRIPLIRSDLLPTVGTGIPTSPIISDFDGDGLEEIFIHGFAGKAYLIDASGKLVRSFQMEVGAKHGTNDDSMVPAFGNPSIATWNGRAYPVTTGVGRRMLVTHLLGGKRFDFQHMLTAWNPLTGAMLKYFPQPIDDMTLGMSAVAVDFDGDGNDEVLASSGGYFIRGYNLKGRLTELDKFHGGWAIRPPALGDFDGDGYWDIGLSTREGYSFIWRTNAAIGHATWPAFKGGNLRQGRLRISFGGN